jgi:hypothetical protein
LKTGLEEIRNIGISIVDDLEKCSLIDCLIRVKAYWSSEGIEVKNIDATVAAIMENLPDNEVLKLVKAAWRASAAIPA